MAEAAVRGNWGQFLINGVLAALPFVSGKVDNVLRKSIDDVGDIAQAGFRSVPQNQISDKSELHLLLGHQRSGSAYFMAGDDYVSRTVRGYNSPNAESLNEQIELAAKLDDSFAWRLITHSEQEMRHIVPTGRMVGDEARRILSEKRIYVISAYNGIALEKPVHWLTNSERYTEAIKNVIVGLEDASPEAIFKLLEETAGRLQKLNIYPKGDKLNERFQTDIMDWFANYLES